MKTELALLLLHDGPILPAKAVADLMRITERTLENQIYAETCPVPMFKVGNKYAAHVTDVAAYIDAQRSGAIELLQQRRKAA